VPTARSAGVAIHWEESGEGTPVLLIMGHSFTSATWWPVVNALAESHRVLTFDNRGVGRSGTSRSWSVQDMVSDAVAVLDAAGCETAHAYGVSMGGGVALELAMSHPDRLRSVVLGCTKAKTEVTPPPTRAKKAILRAIPKAVALRGSGRGLYGDDAPADRVAHDQRVLRESRIPKSGIIRQAEAIAAYATSDAQVRAVTTPTLVLHGTLDPAVPYADGQRLAELVPGARLVSFHGARHNFLIDHGQSANQAVLDFFREVDAEVFARGEASA
jgi:pimeloyl-ACP methyl ester carboxylesterase